MLAGLMIDEEIRAQQFDVYAPGYYALSLPDAWDSHEVLITRAGVSQAVVPEDMEDGTPIINVVLPKIPDAQIRISARRYQIYIANPEDNIRVRHITSEEVQDELTIEGVRRDGEPVAVASLAILDNLVEQPHIRIGHIVLYGIQTDSMLIQNTGDETGMPSHSLLTVRRSMLGGIHADARTMPHEFEDVGVHKLELRRGEMSINGGQRILRSMGNLVFTKHDK